MILPGQTLGVLGGGQLGRMFTAEARRMGYRVVILDPDTEAPAAQIANRHIARPWTDSEALEELAHSCEGVTTEFENVPADVLRALAAYVPVRPRADAVAPTQDRLEEKAFLNRSGIVTAEWAPVRQHSDLATAWAAVGSVAGLLKTARMGYDGKGQAMVTSLAQLEVAHDRLGNVPCILERRVPLERELSVIVARGPEGKTTTWAPGENVHRNGILHTTVVPAMVDDSIAATAAMIAKQIVSALDYVGVMGVEFFVAEGGRVLVNEVAPRPHNSGHWTLDASATSQFEQQVRTLCALPLGDTRLLSPVAMVNLLGDLWDGGTPRWEKALAIPGVRLHLYGKRDARPGRKMGHLTAVAETAERALDAALEGWSVLAANER